MFEEVDPIKFLNSYRKKFLHDIAQYCCLGLDHLSQEEAYPLIAMAALQVTNYLMIVQSFKNRMPNEDMEKQLILY